MKKRVLITGPVPDAATDLLHKKFIIRRMDGPFTEKELRRVVRPFHALLTTLADPVTGSVIQGAPFLECISNYAVGFNNIDLPAARSRGIWVTNTPDVLTEATADLTWALLLSCARRIPEGDRMVRNGRFKGWHPRMLLGVDLLGKTLGIYGFGRIGKAVARRALGWGMKVLYHQRHRESPRIERELNARFVTFDRLVKASDVLTLHAPLSKGTFHRFKKREFRLMRGNCIFLNASRGPLHDEKALYLALKRGWIHSAGLDVYEKEPRIWKGLEKLDNCTLLPHLGSATIGTRDRMAKLAAKNILLALMGKKPKTPVQPRSKER